MMRPFIGLRSHVSAATIYGYFAGGDTQGYSWEYALTDRITFSTAVTASHTAANLSALRCYAIGISDCVTYGYFCGGDTAGGHDVLAVDRITYSTGITASSTNTLANVGGNGSSQSQGLSDGSLYGYVPQGQDSQWMYSPKAAMNFVTFSTGVFAAANGLSYNTSYNGAVSDKVKYGYIAGGCSGTTGTNSVLLTDRITFSTQVVAAATVSNLSYADARVGVSDNVTYGYLAGGLNQATGQTDQMTFSTGVAASHTTSNLSSDRVNSSASSDGNKYGYWAGGATFFNGGGSVVATADQITFSTGATAANTASNLTVARAGAAGLADLAV